MAENSTICPKIKLEIVEKSSKSFEVICEDSKVLKRAQDVLVKEFQNSVDLWVNARNESMVRLNSDRFDADQKLVGSKGNPAKSNVKGVPKKFSRTFLGQGGYGSVFLLERDNQRLVVKEPRKGCSSTSFHQEMELLRGLRHPNIVYYLDRPHDYEDPHEQCIFMEYCSYGSLRAVMNNPKVLYTISSIIDWAEQLFSGIIFLLEHELVHGDIKPDNIMVTEEFVLKIGDLGSAQRLPKDGETSHLVGTDGYMAPEVRCNQANDRSDVYSCGLTLWELIERRKCVTTDDLQVLTFTCCPEDLRAFVRSCCLEDSRLRYRACEAQDRLNHLRRDRRYQHFASRPQPLLRGLSERDRSLIRPIGLDGTHHRYPVIRNDLHDSLLPRSVMNSLSLTDHSTLNQENHDQFIEENEWEKAYQEIKEKLMSCTEFNKFSMEGLVEGNTEPVEGFDFPRQGLLGGLIDRMAYERISKREIIEIDDPNGDHLERLPRGELIQKFLILFEELSKEDQVNLLKEMKSLALKYEVSCSPGHGIKELLKLPPKDHLPQYLRHYFEIILIFDSFIQFYLILSALDAIEMTEVDYLTPWDKWAFLQRASDLIDESNQLFSCRLFFERTYMKDRTIRWLKVEHELEKTLSSYIREDRLEALTKETKSWPISEKAPTYQPLDLEFINRKINEKQKQILISENQRKEANPSADWYIEDLVEKYPRGLEDFFLEFPNIVNINLKSKSRGLEQPFPGYIFQLDFPPEHECKCQKKPCRLEGGFPENCAKELQIKYHECANQEEKDFILTYINLVKIFKVLASDRRDPPRFFGFLKVILRELRALEAITQQMLVLSDTKYRYYWLHDPIAVSRALLQRLIGSDPSPGEQQNSALIQLSNQRLEKIYETQAADRLYWRVAGNDRDPKQISCPWLHVARLDLKDLHQNLRLRFRRFHRESAKRRSQEADPIEKMLIFGGVTLTASLTLLQLLETKSLNRAGI